MVQATRASSREMVQLLYCHRYNENSWRGARPTKLALQIFAEVVILANPIAGSLLCCCGVVHCCWQHCTDGVCTIIQQKNAWAGTWVRLVVPAFSCVFCTANNFSRSLTMRNERFLAADCCICVCCLLLFVYCLLLYVRSRVLLLLSFCRFVVVCNCTSCHFLLYHPCCYFLLFLLQNNNNNGGEEEGHKG